MGAYVLKRLGQSLITVSIVVLTVFLLLRLMPKNGYFTREDYVNMDRDARTAYLRNLGVLDDPFTQFGRFLSGLARGDLGRSITVYPRSPVLDVIGEKAPYSLWFGLAALALSMALGLGLGILMARFKDRFPDGAGTVYVTIVRAIPSLIWLFFIQQWVTALLGWPMVFYEDRPVSWVLPTISLALSGIAWYAIWLRRFMVDEENKDYVKFAVSKGLPWKRVMRGHVLRNALVPLVQYFPQQILLTIAGSLLIESIYSIPGMGGLLVSAIRQQDNPLVQALVLLYSVLGVVGVFLGDLLMVLVDPRIKLAESSGKGAAA
ncbi:MAG TPA: ABC transporter permease [Spirochaetia bacterium]|nr:ABC transporter permease [Spirochaetia bacterium]